MGMFDMGDVGRSIGGPFGGWIGKNGGAVLGSIIGSTINPYSGLGTLLGASDIGRSIGSIVNPYSGLGTLLGAQMDEQTRQKVRQEELVSDQRRFAKNIMKKGEANVGAVRDAYGVIPDSITRQSMKNRSFGVALENKARLGGAIENQASAVRDAGMQSLTGGAAVGEAATRGSSASRGLLGSSLDQQARQGLLATYLGGRDKVAAATQASRQGSQAALDQQRMQQEQISTQRGNVSQIMALQGQQGALRQATAAVPYTNFGNFMGNAMSLAADGQRQEAQGAMGLQFLSKTGASTGAKSTKVGA